jgi:hypothetical protein
MSAPGAVSIAFANTGFVLLCTIPSKMLPPCGNDLIEVLKRVEMEPPTLDIENCGHRFAFPL